MPKLEDLTNRRFGALEVRKLVGTARGFRWWDCQCDCGRSIFAHTAALVRGNTSSCGCGQRAAAAEVCRARGVHFMRGTRLYTIWRGMLSRCYRETATNYIHYGGRGISVCKSWRESFITFARWAAANGYRDDLTLDRVDVNGNYRPGNCRWADAATQAANRRPRRA